MPKGLLFSRGSNQYWSEHYRHRPEVPVSLTTINSLYGLKSDSSGSRQSPAMDYYYTKVPMVPAGNWFESPPNVYAGVNQQEAENYGNIFDLIRSLFERLINWILAIDSENDLTKIKFPKYKFLLRLTPVDCSKSVAQICFDDWRGLIFVRRSPPKQ